MVDDVPGWRWEGNTSLLDLPMTAVMLSRQSRRPHPSDWWVRAAPVVVKKIAEGNQAFICGGGIIQLDYVRWAAHKHGKAVYLKTPESKRGNRRDDDVPPWNHLELKPWLEIKPAKKEAMVIRDRLMTALADRIVVIACRSGGNMEEVCRNAIKSGKRVAVLEPPFRKREVEGNFRLLEVGAEKLDLDVPELEPTGSPLPPSESDPLALPDLQDYLWHFTREYPGPWPGQSWEEYFASLASGDPASAHDAVHTLEYILQTGVVKAQSGMVRGGYEVSCWSAVSPIKLAQKPVYRKTLGRWNFKPYAIGIRRDMLNRMGAREVIYSSDEEYMNIPESDRYLFQPAKTKTADWRAEKEWRINSDVVLNKIEPEDGLVLVGKADDIRRIEVVCPFRVISLDNLI